MTINQLTTLGGFDGTDKFIFQRKVDSFFLTYKGEGARLSKFFPLATKKNNYKSKMDEIKTTLKEIQKPYATKTDFKNATTIESMDVLKDSLITDSTLKSKMDGYATKDQLKTVENEWDQDTDKLREEMSDFSAAAMVGILQSSMPAAAEEEGGEEKE